MLTLSPIFISKIQAQLKDESEFFFDALSMPPAVSIRLNPFKPVDVFDQTDAVPWCNMAFNLNQRPSFIADPLFHAGAYYVQESSSMFLHHVYTQIRNKLSGPVSVLDVCAAPGGKSTLIASLLHDDDVLLSNEIIRTRVLTLMDNVNKWGRANTFVSNNDPADLGRLTHLFDVILVDAPCSGEGMFRKDKHAINEWSEANVELCAARQKRILHDVLPALKPGGMLIYATCTFNHEENEDNIKWLNDKHGFEPVEIAIPDSWPIEKTAYHGFRFWPHKVKGEGLFVVCLRKPSESNSVTAIKTKSSMVNAKQKALLASYLNESDSFQIAVLNNDFIAIPVQFSGFYDKLNGLLRLVKAGICLGELKHDQLIPAHELALSVNLSSDIPRAELTLEQAQSYLKKGSLPTSCFNGIGWQTVTYKGLSLGWVKVLPNRVNNYLPAALRILKDIEE
ncbi:MAG: methyltransferase RsmF C-terminal domain-like protein [Bacteroidota bacterium]